VKPNTYGHVICNENPGTGQVDFLTISNLTLFCNRDWQPTLPEVDQSDGVHLEISPDTNQYAKGSAYNRVQHVHVFSAQRDGFMFAGNGESVIADICSMNAGRYGMFFNALIDSVIIRANAGSSGKTGMRIYRSGTCHFIGCKSFFNGSGGGTDAADSANWYLGADQMRNGSTYLTSCEGQESRGSSWVIDSGMNVLNGCLALDPGRDNSLLMPGGISNLPLVIAGFHLRGVEARLNRFSDCVAQPSLGLWQIGTFTGSISGTTMNVTAIQQGSLGVGQLVVGPGVALGTRITAAPPAGTPLPHNYTVSISQTVASQTLRISNWGFGQNAVHIDGVDGSGAGPQVNRGDIYTFQSTTNSGGTIDPGTTYRSGFGPKGGAGTSNAKNTGLRVDGVACT
jgi:hypothetical protein